MQWQLALGRLPAISKTNAVLPARLPVDNEHRRAITRALNPVP
jgi:hypothetical protein